MTLIKAGDLLGAKEHIDQAALYATTSKERARMLIVRYQLLATEMESDPSLFRLKLQFQTLDLGLRERPDDIFFLGYYVIASTFAQWKLTNLPETVLAEIQHVGLHFYSKYRVQAALPSSYNSKYAKRLNAEIFNNVNHLPILQKNIWKLVITSAA